MSLKNKQKLVKILVQSEQYESAASLANQLGVSPRTVYSYLDEVENLVKMTDILLEKIPGMGTKIVGNKKDKEQLLQSVYQEPFLDLDPLERQELLLKQLLKGHRVSYYTLAEKYFVSRSTIVKDMRSVKARYFPDEQLLTSNNKGTLLKTDERTLQSLWAKYLSSNYERCYDHPPVTLQNYSKFIAEELGLSTTFLSPIFIEVEKIGTCFQLADYYRLHFFENLVVMSYRISQNYHHEKSSGYVFERVNELDTYYIAYDIASRLETGLGIPYTIEDKVFLNECLTANGIKNTNLKDTPTYYDGLVKDLIGKTSQVMNEDLTEDEQLREGLLHHISPMCFRLENGIVLQNPYIHEIKKQYSMMFHLTWYVVVDLENKLGKQIPEDEIAFLMIHFQSALERKRDIKKILIISQTGLLTTELLERRIKQFLPSVHIYEVISADQINQVHLTKVDLIISTVALNIKAPPVIPLSSIPTDIELKELITKVDTYFAQQSNQLIRSHPTINEHPLIASLRKRLSITRGHVHSYDEAITSLTSSLIESGMVTEQYLTSVFEREDMSSTAYETGIAIPHGNPAYVNKTQISILINDKKISWGSERVDVVVLISVAKVDISYISQIIEPLYNVMRSRADVEQLFLHQSDQSIYRFFARYH